MSSIKVCDGKCFQFTGKPGDVIAGLTYSGVSYRKRELCMRKDLHIFLPSEDPTADRYSYMNAPKKLVSLKQQHFTYRNRNLRIPRILKDAVGINIEQMILAYNHENVFSAPADVFVGWDIDLVIPVFETAVEISQSYYELYKRKKLDRLDTRAVVHDNLCNIRVYHAEFFGIYCFGTYEVMAQCGDNFFKYYINLNADDYKFSPIVIEDKYTQLDIKAQ